MTSYELIYIVTPLMEQADANVAAGKVRDFILGLGASIKKETAWEKRKLAYPIKKQAAGFYFIIEMDMEAEKAPELKHFLKMNKDILRDLLLDTSTIKPAKARVRSVRTKTASIAGETSSAAPAKKERVKIEELDKKLEELLKE